MLRAAFNFITITIYYSTCSVRQTSEHAVFDADRDEDEEEDDDVTSHVPPVTGNRVPGQLVREGVHLVSAADEDEDRDEDIEDGIGGHEDEDSVCVCCQPNVVLQDEQLQ